MDMRIPGNGEALLEWFFGYGQTIAERASRVEHNRHGLQSLSSEPCERCDGLGLHPDDPKLECFECRGRGVIAGGPHKAQPYDAWKACPSCNGIVGVNFDCECCRGRGCTDGVTATAANEDGEEPSYTLDEEMIARFGIISRRLGALREKDKSHARALELYFGNIGKRWGNRIALYPLTECGQKLIKIAQAESKLPDLMSAMELLANEIDAHRPSKKALVDAADLQARTLYQAACKTWNNLEDRK